LLPPKLKERYQQVHEQERTAAWLAEREAAWLAKLDALKPERDALAAELPEVYADRRALRYAFDVACALPFSDLIFDSSPHSGRVGRQPIRMIGLNRNRPSSQMQR
jgi:hypothetical protein